MDYKGFFNINFFNNKINFQAAADKGKRKKGKSTTYLNPYFHNHFSLPIDLNVCQG